MSRDPPTRVLALAGEQALVVEHVDGPRLLLQSPAEAQAGLDGAVADQPTVIYLGQDEHATAHLVLATPEADPPSAPAPGARWAGLREVGALLDDMGAGEMVTAVALANWHATHPRCARCGERTKIIPRKGALHLGRDRNPGCFVKSRGMVVDSGDEPASFCFVFPVACMLVEDDMF